MARHVLTLTTHITYRDGTAELFIKAFTSGAAR